MKSTGGCAWVHLKSQKRGARRLSSLRCFFSRMLPILTCVDHVLWFSRWTSPWRCSIYLSGLRCTANGDGQGWARCHSSALSREPQSLIQCGAQSAAWLVHLFSALQLFLAQFSPKEPGLFSLQLDGGSHLSPHASEYGVRCTSRPRRATYWGVQLIEIDPAVCFLNVKRQKKLFLLSSSFSPSYYLQYDFTVGD